MVCSKISSRNHVNIIVVTSLTTLNTPKKSSGTPMKYKRDQNASSCISSWFFSTAFLVKKSFKNEKKSQDIKDMPNFC